jgi:hypothetical protein
MPEPIKIPRPPSTTFVQKGAVEEVRMPKAPVIDEERLIGSVDRNLSELKYVLDNPEQFDTATFQTLKHHIEDMGLFVKYAEGKLAAMKKIKSLPPLNQQRESGY